MCHNVHSFVLVVQGREREERSEGERERGGQRVRERWRERERGDRLWVGVCMDMLCTYVCVNS